MPPWPAADIPLALMAYRFRRRHHRSSLIERHVLGTLEHPVIHCCFPPRLFVVLGQISRRSKSGPQCILASPVYSASLISSPMLTIRSLAGPRGARVKTFTNVSAAARRSSSAREPLGGSDVQSIFKRVWVSPKPPPRPTCAPAIVPRSDPGPGYCLWWCRAEHPLPCVVASTARSYALDDGESRGFRPYKSLVVLLNEKETQTKSFLTAAQNRLSWAGLARAGHGLIPRRIVPKMSILPRASKSAPGSELARESAPAIM